MAIFFHVARDEPATLIVKSIDDLREAFAWGTVELILIFVFERQKDLKRRLAPVPTRMFAILLSFASKLAHALLPHAPSVPESHVEQCAFFFRVLCQVMATKLPREAKAANVCGD